MRYASVHRRALLVSVVLAWGAGMVSAGIVFIDMQDMPLVGEVLVSSPPFQATIHQGPPCEELPPGLWGPPCIAVYDSPFASQDGSVTRFEVGDLVGPGLGYATGVVLAGFELQNPAADPNEWQWDPIQNDWFDSSGAPVRGYMGWSGVGADGSVYYGWLEVTVTYDQSGQEFNAILHGLAYQTTPGRPVSAGDTGGFCPGDLDGDGEVGLADLSILLANYGAASGMGYHDGNLDADGDVDLADLSRLLSAYGTSCE